MSGTTREQWLQAVADGMRPMFVEAGAPIPDRVRITMSLIARKTVGRCYDPECSGDGVPEILIRLDQHDPERVADILAHELVHAAVGIDAKHGRRFRKVATAIGLEGKMTATVAGERFKESVAPILAELGPFPHAKFTGADNKRSGRKKQKTYLLKAACSGCGYTVRVTQKHVDNAGPPLCPARACDNYTEPMDLAD